MPGRTPIIRLTITEGVPLYVNAGSISRWFAPSGQPYTVVFFKGDNDGHAMVTETPERISELIESSNSYGDINKIKELESKLNKSRCAAKEYRAACIRAHSLMELAKSFQQ